MSNKINFDEIKNHILPKKDLDNAYYHEELSESEYDTACDIYDPATKEYITLLQDYYKNGGENNSYFAHEEPKKQSKIELLYNNYQYKLVVEQYPSGHWVRTFYASSLELILQQIEEFVAKNITDNSYSLLTESDIYVVINRLYGDLRYYLRLYVLGHISDLELEIEDKIKNLKDILEKKEYGYYDNELNPIYVLNSTYVEPFGTDIKVKVFKLNLDTLKFELI